MKSKASKSIVALTSLLCVAFVASAISVSLTKLPAERVADATWPVFSSYDELSSASDAIVRGHVVGIDGVMHDDATGMVETQFSFDVVDTLKGTAEDEIIVVQTGGVWEGVRHSIRDDPLFEIGDEMILVLTRFDDPDGKIVYAALGGPQGSFLITNGEVFSTDARVHDAYWLRMKEPGTPLQEFVAKLEGAQS